MGLFRKLQAATGEPLYLQLMQQIRHAVETGALQDGAQLPSIRALADELIVSPNTIVKAYSDLAHEGVVELRHGAGAFICVKHRTRSLADRVQASRIQFRDLIEALRRNGLRDEEICRAFDAEMATAIEKTRRR